MAFKDPSYRDVYTADQVEQFFDRIALPKKYRNSPVIKSKDAAKTAEGLVFATALQKYFLANMVWENLELHYSSHHTITLDPMHLFHKMVERKTGRGGYCMENTSIFGTVLRSLGYDIMSTGARVNEAVQPIAAKKNWKGPRYDGWNHMVNIATFDGKPYLIDVGFGSNSPTAPVPLIDGYTSIKVLPSNRELLKFMHISDNTHRGPGQALWVYHFRFEDEGPWIPAYCFSEIEFLPSDFNTMNFFVSRSPTSWFTQSVVCLKFIMNEEEEMIGDVTLFGNEIRRRELGGKSVELAKIESEEDRIEALREFLGVTLTQPEKDGIKGLVTALD